MKSVEELEIHQYPSAFKNNTFFLVFVFVFEDLNLKPFAFVFQIHVHSKVSANTLEILFSQLHYLFIIM